MDFFEHQRTAKTNTLWLSILFAGAVTLIILLIYGVVLCVAAYQQQVSAAGGVAQSAPSAEFAWWHTELFLTSAVGTLFVVFLGTACKTWSLAGGGTAVAESLGGRQLNRNTTDPAESRLLNVVDEMAIASGIPCPPVYLLDDENGINAFAAGDRPDNAVIGITKGCLDTLDRDELQGVMAHEFSHIFNGDMKLNLRMMGLLHGILLISIAGNIMMRSVSLRTGRRHRHRSNDNDAKGAIFILCLGVALFLIGSVGVFFARLIKAAVSRQREFLADAAAVQFTRNPDGIAGALKKIGGLLRGARLHSPKAEEASHLFFGNAFKGRWFATHPPLIERIRRIEPGFEGNFPRVAHSKTSHSGSSLVSQLATGNQLSASDVPVDTALSTLGQAAKVRFDMEAAIARVGTLLPENLQQAQKVQSQIPQTLRTLTQDSFGACVTVYSLLLDRNADIRQRQIASLAKHAQGSVLREMKRHWAAFRQLSAETKLPLVELAMPALKQLTGEQYQGFQKNLNRLISADNDIQLFEFLLRRTVLSHLKTLHDTTRRKQRPESVTQVHAAAADLISALATAGHSDRQQAVTALQQSMHSLSPGWNVNSQTDTGDQIDFVAADRALTLLSDTTLNIKQRVLRACAVCIEHDGQTTPGELLLLRVIGDALGLPMPLQKTYSV
jgi:Zn-dependent protease with chaperone function